MSTSAAAPSTTSRGHLLREVARLSDEILSTNVRFTDVSSRLQRELEGIARLQKELKEADDDLKAVVAQKKYESENDTELSSLQRVVAALTLKRMELIRQTKAARAERERLKEGVRAAYYSRIGAAAEAAMVAASTGLLSAEYGAGHDQLAPLGLANLAAAAAGGWSPLLVGLWQDAEALWKRVSTLSETTRDLVEGAMALRGLRLTADPAIARCPFDTAANPPSAAANIEEESSASGNGSSQSSAPKGVGFALAAGAAAANKRGAGAGGVGTVNLSADSVDFEASAAGAPVYGALGEEHVLNDAKKAVASVASFEGEWRRLVQRVSEVKQEMRAELAAVMGSGSDAAANEEGEEDKESDALVASSSSSSWSADPQLSPFAGNVAAVETVATTLQGIRQSLEIQRSLLRAIVGGSAEDEDEEAQEEEEAAALAGEAALAAAAAVASARASQQQQQAAQQQQQQQHREQHQQEGGGSLNTSVSSSVVTAGTPSRGNNVAAAGGVSSSSGATPRRPEGSPAASVTAPSPARGPRGGEDAGQQQQQQHSWLIA